MKIRLNQDDNGPLKGFLYMWLKKVHGFDPSIHCAQCLKGSYFKEMNKHFQSGVDIELPDLAPGEIYYLCGVATPYKWARNFHLAFKAGNYEINGPLYTGAEFVVDDAEIITFDDKAARELYPDKGPKFLTCRNFQFGAHHFKQGSSE